jgi:hypothetical protein
LSTKVEELTRLRIRGTAFVVVELMGEEEEGAAEVELTLQLFV